MHSDRTSLFGCSCSYTLKETFLFALPLCLGTACRIGYSGPSFIFVLHSQITDIYLSIICRVGPLSIPQTKEAITPKTYSDLYADQKPSAAIGSSINSGPRGQNHLRTPICTDYSPMSDSSHKSQAQFYILYSIIYAIHPESEHREFDCCFVVFVPYGHGSSVSKSPELQSKGCELDP